MEQLTIFDTTERTTPIFPIGSFVLLAFDQGAADELDILYMYEYGKSFLGERGRVLNALEHKVYEIIIETSGETVYWYERDLILMD